MKKVKKPSELEKSLNEKVKKYDASISQILLFEAFYLRECIEKQIDAYYASYSPTVYLERTYNMKDSLLIGTAVRDGRYYSINLYFTSLGYKPSVIDPDNHDRGFTPLLINEGWEWRNPGKFKGRMTDRVKHHFISYAGFHFVEKGIEDWNNKYNKYNFTVYVIKRHTGQGRNINQVKAITKR